MGRGVYRCALRAVRKVAKASGGVASIAPVGSLVSVMRMADGVPSQVLEDVVDEVLRLLGGEGRCFEAVECDAVLAQPGLRVEEHRAVRLVEVHGVQLRYGALGLVDGLAGAGEGARGEG